MLSNDTFLETKIQRLLDGLIFVEKGLGVHVQGMLEMSRGFLLAEILSKIIEKKSEGNLGILFATLFCQINDLVPTYFLLNHIMRSLLAPLPPLHSGNVD